MPNREKVTFPANIPTCVILAGAGQLQPSTTNGADEYRYFLADEQIMWVPPAVHNQIVELGAAEGDALTIERSKPGKAAATWIVHQADSTGHGYSNGPSPAQANADARTRNARPDLQPAQRMPAQEAGREVRTAGQGWTQREPTSQAPPPSSAQDHQSGARTHQQPQPAAQLAADAPELATTPADRMAQALKDAIDLTRGAKQYAPEISWSTSDIRAIANTLFIDGGGK
jgi:hypothetical protein